jgi:hypothetical protein
MGSHARSSGAALSTRLTVQERTMSAYFPIVHRVADLCRKVLQDEADDRHGTGRQGANDLLLVVGVAAVVLGVVMVSQGALPSQSAAPRVPRAHAALLSAQRAVPAPDERLATHTSLTTRIPPAPATRTASNGATRVVAACAPHLDLDHDLRLVLAAMALQRRRTLHATANFVPSDKQDVPASVRVLARASVAHAEASPPAARAPHGPGC